MVVTGDTQRPFDSRRAEVAPRLYLIDGLRTICALIVVIYHYHDMFTNKAAEAAGLRFDSNRSLAFFKPILWVVDDGPLAVMVFWAISGFIFTHMYAASRTISGRKFFVRRFSRLYPLHFATLIYVAILQVVSVQSLGTQIMQGNNSVVDFIRQLFFVSAWWGDDIFSFNLPVWSVSVEVAIYVVFFVVLRFFGITLITTSAAAMVCAGFMVFKSTLIPACGVYFFLGAAACAMLGQIERLAARHKTAAILALCGAAILPLLVETGLGKHLPLTLVMAPLCAIGLFLLAFLENLLPRTLVFLEPVGDITYSTYLLHIPMQMTFVFAMLAGWVSPVVLLHPLAPWVYIVAVVVAGHYCFRHFERPAQSWLRRVL